MNERSALPQPMTRQEMLAWLALLNVCLDLRNPTPELKRAIAAVEAAQRKPWLKRKDQT